ncbi:MAG: hypothetical protein V4772_25790 [Pseudomonadota bacterium]
MGLRTIPYSHFQSSFKKMSGKALPVEHPAWLKQSAVVNGVVFRATYASTKACSASIEGLAQHAA